MCTLDYRWTTHTNQSLVYWSGQVYQWWPFFWWKSKYDIKNSCPSWTLCFFLIKWFTIWNIIDKFKMILLWLFRFRYDMNYLLRTLVRLDSLSNMWTKYTKGRENYSLYSLLTIVHSCVLSSMGLTRSLVLKLLWTHCCLLFKINYIHVFLLCYSSINSTLLFTLQSLLTVNTQWFTSRLIQLPDQYYKIFQAYRKKTCPECSNIPKDPSICLVCGVFLCFRESCCRQLNVFECVQVREYMVDNYILDFWNHIFLLLFITLFQFMISN